MKLIRYTYQVIDHATKAVLVSGVISATTRNGAEAMVAKIALPENSGMVQQVLKKEGQSI